jgi:alanine dehydrogenase
MQIGLPREIKDGECRVALTPAAVQALTLTGNTVLVESGAGDGSGFSDQDYGDAGARIVGLAEQAFAAELVVKVKEIQPGEWQHLRPGGMLFSFLHLPADPAMARELLSRRITGIAFETVTAADGRLPILAPMSAIAGELAVVIGANLLTTPQGGRGIAVNDARVVVIGAGNVGQAAAQMAAKLEANVAVVSRPGPRLEGLLAKAQDNLAIHRLAPGVLSRLVNGADLVIAAVNVPGATTPKLLSRAEVRSMGEGSVLMEVCIDGGGISETARPTSHFSPTYVEEGVTHYCVANMPAAVPRSASASLSDAILPYVMALANSGLTQAMREDDGFAQGLQLHAGQVTHQTVAAALQCPFVDLDAVLFSC